MAFSMGDGDGHDEDAPARPMAEINVTPMVDVMLVLLIIFMVAAPMMMVGVPVNLPRTAATRVAQTRVPLVVSVQRDGRVFIRQEEVSEADLVAQLTERHRDDPDAPVYVRGDRAVPYGEVMRVMGRLTQAGIGRISLIAESDPGAPAPGLPDMRRFGSTSVAWAASGALHLGAAAWFLLTSTAVPPPVRIEIADIAMPAMEAAETVASPTPSPTQATAPEQTVAAEPPPEPLDTPPPVPVETMPAPPDTVVTAEAPPVEEPPPETLQALAPPDAPVVAELPPPPPEPPTAATANAAGRPGRAVAPDAAEAAQAGGRCRAAGRARAGGRCAARALDVASAGRDAREQPDAELRLPASRGAGAAQALSAQCPGAPGPGRCGAALPPGQGWQAARLAYRSQQR